MADFSEVEARTFFQNLTLMDSEEIAKLDGRPIIPSAGADECRAAVLAFNERMVPRRRELGLGDTAVVGKTKKSETTSKVVPMKKEQAVHGLGRVDFSGLGYGWGTGYPDSLSVDAIGIDFPSGEHNIILNFSPITHAPDVDGRKLFCHETTIGYDLNADSWSGATIGPDFWTLDGKEAREFAENIGLDRLAARACVRLGIEAPGLKGREALPIPKATDVVPEPSVQAEAAKNAVTEVTVIPAWVSFPDEPGTAQYRLFCEQDTEPLDIDEQIFFSGYTAEELCGMVGKTVNGDFTIVGVEEPEKMKATYVRPVQKAYNPADMAAAANHIVEHHGGIVVVENGVVKGSVVLEIAGIMSDRPLTEVNDQLEAAKVAAFELGVSRGIDPFMTLSFMALPVIPKLRITTRGVIDVETQQYV